MEGLLATEKWKSCRLRLIARFNAASFPKVR